MKQCALFFLPIILITPLFQCVSNKQKVTVVESVDIQSLAEERLSGSTKCVNNSDGNYVLCFTNAKKVNATKVTFIVLNNENGEILVDVNSISGTVKWHNATQLEIMNHPGYRIRDEELKNITYLYDIIKKKRVAANK